MDPIGAIASIAAVLSLVKDVVEYLDDVRNATKDQQKLRSEASNTQHLLIDLVTRIANSNTQDPWFIGVRSLIEKGGLLDQLQVELQSLRKKSGANAGEKGTLKDLGRRVVWTLTKKDIDGLLAAIERLKSNIQQKLAKDQFELTLNVNQTTSDTHGDVQKVLSNQEEQELRARDQERQEIAEALSPLDFMGTVQNDTLVQREPGTGEWFLETKEFKEWVNGTQKFLWCPGIPGAGKTVLAAIAIDYLQNEFKDDKAYATLCIYCRYKEHIMQTTGNLVKALLKQLVYQRQAVSESVRSMYRKRQHVKDIPFATLRTEIAAYKRVFVVVDALDECNEEDGTRADLLTILGSQPDKISILVTSRPHLHNEPGLADATRLDIQAADEDIACYTRNRIPREPRLFRNVQLDKTLHEYLIRELIGRAKGMFLLAKFHMDSLARKTNPRAVREALEQLPEKLEGHYEGTIERIQTQGEDDRQLAEGVLSWIALAVRPLSMEEVQHALAIRPTDTDMDTSGLSPGDLLISVCAGLVTVDQEGRILRLVHYTTQEYFNKNAEFLYPRAHLKLASTCLTYLLFDVFEAGLLESYEAVEARKKNYPFLDYAARFWSRHIRGEAEEILQDRVMELLLNDAKTKCAFQAAISSNHRGYGQSSPEGTSGIHYAAICDLGITVTYFITKGTPADLRDPRDRTPLSWASAHGILGTVKLLADREDVLVDSEDMDGQTPFWWAVQNRHEPVVRYLLTRGDVNPEYLNKNRQTPFFRAVAGGDDKIISMLLERGTDPNLKDFINCTPLWWAGYRGHPHAAKVLMELGVDDNIVNVHHCTPVMVCILRNTTPVLRVILEMSKDVSKLVRHDSGGTPLHHAAKEGRADQVELLLDFGSDATARDWFGKTPVHYAAQEGHDKAVRVFVARDVGLNVRDRRNKTPLDLATERMGEKQQCENVVKILKQAEEKSSTDVKVQPQA